MDEFASIHRFSFHTKRPLTFHNDLDIGVHNYWSISVLPDCYFAGRGRLHSDFNLVPFRQYLLHHPCERGAGAPAPSTRTKLGVWCPEAEMYPWLLSDDEAETELAMPKKKQKREGAPHGVHKPELREDRKLTDDELAAMYMDVVRRREDLHAEYVPPGKEFDIDYRVAKKNAEVGDHMIDSIRGEGIGKGNKYLSDYGLKASITMTISTTAHEEGHAAIVCLEWCRRHQFFYGINNVLSQFYSHKAPIFSFFA